MFNEIKQFLAPLRYWRELPLRECGDRPALSQKPNQSIPPLFIKLGKIIYLAKAT